MAVLANTVIGHLRFHAAVRKTTFASADITAVKAGPLRETFGASSVTVLRSTETSASAIYSYKSPWYRVAPLVSVHIRIQPQVTALHFVLP